MSIFNTLSEQEALRTDGSMRRAAKLRQDLNDHERATIRLFERIKTQTDEAAEQRMIVDFPLSPEMAAAYAVWCQENRDAERLTMTFPPPFTDVTNASPLNRRASWADEFFPTEKHFPPLPPVTEDNR